MALAARARPRRGLAASVTRIRPRRYSAVMNCAPTTSTATSARNRPASSTSMGTPPVTSGAMSPDPVTVKALPAWRYPASCPVTYGELGPPLTEVPVQELPGQPPCRPTRPKVAVASVGAAVPDALVICWLSCCADPGEVTNSPACTAGASPGRVTVPILVQLAPSAES